MIDKKLMAEVEAQFVGQLGSFMEEWEASLRRRAGAVKEGCEPNKGGTGHHDTETGHPCSPGGGDTGSAGATHPAVSSWAARAASVPAKMYAKAKGYATTKYTQLEGRYGRKWAVAIMAAGVAGVPLPVPGSMMLTAAPVIAAAEIAKRLGGVREGMEAETQLSDEQVERLGKAWVEQLMAEWRGEGQP